MVGYQRVNSVSMVKHLQHIEIWAISEGLSSCVIHWFQACPSPWTSSLVSASTFRSVCCHGQFEASDRWGSAAEQVAEQLTTLALPFEVGDGLKHYGGMGVVTGWDMSTVSIYLYLYLSMSIYLYLSLSMSIYLYLCLSMSSYLYLCLAISIYVYLCLSIFIYVYLSLSMFFYV